jgi:hypothetical protein
MFRRPGSKQPDPTEATRGAARSQQSFFPSWKHGVDFSNSITNVVHAAFKDRAAFTALGGAVFALQQDMHRALGINLWNAHILIKPLFADARMVLPAASQQHLSEQLPRLLEILEGIMDINGDFAKQFTNRRREPAEQLSADTLAQVFLAGLRNKAAAIWLLTVLPTDRGGNPLAASKIWLRLGVIPIPELAEAAEALTGTYFNGVRTTQFLTNAWPLLLA